MQVRKELTWLIGCCFFNFTLAQVPPPSQCVCVQQPITETTRDPKGFGRGKSSSRVAQVQDLGYCRHGRKKEPRESRKRRAFADFYHQDSSFCCNGAQRRQNCKRLLEPSLGWEKWMQRLVKENFLTIPHTIRVEERLSRGRRCRGGMWRRRMRRQAIMSVNSE